MWQVEDSSPSADPHRLGRVGAGRRPAIPVSRSRAAAGTSLRCWNQAPCWQDPMLVDWVLVDSVLVGSVLESDTVLSFDRPYGGPSRRTMPQRWCGADSPPGRASRAIPVPGRPGPDRG